MYAMSLSELQDCLSVTQPKLCYELLDRWSWTSPAVGTFRSSFEDRNSFKKISLFLPTSYKHSTLSSA